MATATFWLTVLSSTTRMRPARRGSVPVAEVDDGRPSRAVNQNVLP